MRYRHRLRSRIIVSFVLFGTVLTGLFAVATLAMRQHFENQLIENTLQREVDRFVEFKRENPDPDAPFHFSRHIEIQVVTPARFANVPFAWRNLDNGVYTFEETGEDGEPRHYKLAVRRDQDLWGFLWYEYTQEMLGRQQLMVAALVALVAFCLLSLVLGFWSSARVMRPVSDLARRLEHAGTGGGLERLAPHFADDEVGQLAQALDNYATRLTELVERDREFNADVSHELRTPLSVINGAVELMLGQKDLDEKTRARLKRIERAAQQSTDLTQSLLLLSRGDRAVTAGERCEVRRLAELLAETNRAHLNGKPVDVRVEGEDELTVPAPEAVVSVALGNLVANACKYTREGEVVIRVGKGQVEIDDTGPGLSEEDSRRVFERHYRGRAATGKGAGIGLAIVTRLCDLYRWRVTLEPRKEGGARATLDFRLRN
ncbi:MAG TPA: HAMP domain-containing sensor histidine kinase [Xanthomonadaceae bacterium]|nr:HAMP domain-containing sensor histidine kinase [Xanthomonadaceae bacterium]